MIFCPICGSGNADSAKFCSECGKSLFEGAPSPPRTATSKTIVLDSNTDTTLEGESLQESLGRTFSFDLTVGEVQQNPTVFLPPSSQPQTEPTSTEPTPIFLTEPMQKPGSPVLPSVPTERKSPGTAPSQRMVPEQPGHYSGGLPAPPVEQPGRFPDFRETLSRLQQSQSLTPQIRKADILFVLDCTGSMQGEIDAIKDTILAFVDEISRDGIRVRVGLLAFGDRYNGEESFIFSFAGQSFTDDAALFRQEVSRLRAGGGGDIPESSLDAVLLAVRQSFAPDASKVLVLVTDAPPHIPDVEAKSLEQVSNAIREAGVKQLYLVIRTQDPASNVYLKLLEGTQGLAFELGSGEDFRTRAENFKKTLRALGRTISTGTR